MTRKLPETEGKRHQVGFRTTRELKDRIEAEAKANGRSIAQEIEFRLEAGYEISAARKAVERANATASTLMGDEKTAAMIRAMTAGIGAVMRYSGKHWDRDIYTRAAVKACIDAARVGSFKNEKMDIEDPADVDADLVRKFDKIGRMFGGLMSLSRDTPETMAVVEAFAESGDLGADPDTVEIIASLLRRL